MICPRCARFQYQRGRCLSMTTRWRQVAQRVEGHRCWSGGRGPMHGGSVSWHSRFTSVVVEVFCCFCRLELQTNTCAPTYNSSGGRKERELTGYQLTCESSRAPNVNLRSTHQVCPRLRSYYVT